jgi:hypothetical protein
MICLWASYKKKYEKKILFVSLKIKEERSPDPLVRATGTDPQHWLELYTGKYLDKAPFQHLTVGCKAQV